MELDALKLTVYNLQEKYRLTPREKEVLILLAKTGLDNKEIGNELCISEKTVKNHIGNMFSKMNIKSTRQLFSMIINH
ncbi:response regulator transcription factor [Chengkuizengella axinellae]|uniref:LuxR C-terminal-related transcriptional regulator n=1 Tax=Chengkuizengella axinellae TaxID=3064388 RepID=A0ABT9J0X1_9BACL|nr:LuxR C-terminal-related transcriptional regulator [Chengkuizengella sp. 2205SS18-9]MDP5275232.1 LuxR C-terminal-related transcriptional regulator [Chengkuizengella sp. 2205SS18-9]